MKKLINNSSGFSLAEIMIAAAIMGALSLVLMQITRTTSKTSSKLSFSTEIATAANEINAILSKPSTCLAVLGGTLAPSNINGKYFTRASGSSPVNGYGSANFFVDSYSVVDIGGNTAELKIKFENKEILKGLTTVEKKINIYYEGAVGAMTACRSQSSGSTDIWTRGLANKIYYSGGYVGVGTGNSPQFPLDVNGDIRTNTYIRALAFYATSDKRLKTNIRPIKSALESLDAINGVTYNWNENAKSRGMTDESRQLGLIAQDVEKVFPEAVNTTQDGYKSVNYQSLVAPIVEGVKELHAQNKKEEIEIKKLKNENQKIKAWICKRDKSAPICLK
jgi:hypothetical protein